MSEELKPCPFCGGEAKAKKEDGGPGYQVSSVRCRQCGAVIGQIGFDAVEKWNTRTDIPREWWERLRVRVYGFEAVNIKHLYSMMDDIEKGE